MGQTLSKRIVDYYKTVPQEKIYLHTDKTNYIAGDSIWFRGYLVNAVTNRQSLLSYYIYVDLIDIQNNTTLSHSLIASDSMWVFKNAIPLSPKLQTGTYRIVAYTGYMRNFDESRFFNKLIHVDGLKKVVSDQSTSSSAKEKGKNKKSFHSGEDLGKASGGLFSLSLMPEGGQFIDGVMQKLAFKAVAPNGKGVDVDVRMVDSLGNTITEGKSQHLGMGCLQFQPSSQMHYFLNATTANGETQRVKVPDALPSGATLTVVQHGGNLLIKPLITPDIDITKLAIVIHGSLNIAAGEKINGKEFKIPLTNFHEGVTLVSLINKEDSQIVAERAVFLRGKNSADSCRNYKIEQGFTVGKPKVRSLVKATIQVPEGMYSIAVTDKVSAPEDSIQDNITSTLLLSSELRGYVEQPRYYFDHIDKKVDADLDVLMLTQAWRRYDITHMLKDIKPECKFPIEQSQIISGEVGGIWKKNMKSPSLLILCSNPKLMKIIDLEKSGRFSIEGLQFADSTRFLLSALNHKGKTSYMELKVDEPDIPLIQPLVWDDALDMPEVKDAMSLKLRISHLKNLTLVELPDIEVVGTKINRPINSYGITPDKSIGCEDEWFKSFNTMEDVLYYFNCDMTTSEFGRQCFAGVAYVDDFAYDPDYFMDIIPQDIERIEYIRKRNPSAMIFTDTDGNFQKAVDHGVLIVKLKRGGQSSEQTGKHAFATKVIMPQGYKWPVEFYNPVYDTPERKNATVTDIRTTVYWNPSLKIDKSGKAEIEFYMPDNPVELRYDLQGLGPAGPVSVYKQ